MNPCLLPLCLLKWSLAAVTAGTPSLVVVLLFFIWCWAWHISSLLKCFPPAKLAKIPSMCGKGYCSAWSTGLTETLKSPQTRVFHFFCRKNRLRSHPHRQNCYVLTKLNEPHQSSVAVHLKHVLLQICARIQFTYFHIWQMPQGDHNRISHVVAKYFCDLLFCHQ